MKKLREKFNVLHKFSDNEWNYFAQKFTPKTFERDELLLRAGQVERYLYFIKTGLVRKYYLRQGREHCIDFMMDNQLVSSYASFVQQKPSSLNIRAIKKTDVEAISYTEMQDIYCNTDMGNKMGRLICEQLYVNKVIRESSLIMESPDKRFQRLVENKKDLILHVPQYFLASYLNLTPETLSRIKRRNFKNRTS